MPSPEITKTLSETKQVIVVGDKPNKQRPVLRMLDTIMGLGVGAVLAAGLGNIPIVDRALDTMLFPVVKTINSVRHDDTPQVSVFAPQWVSVENPWKEALFGTGFVPAHDIKAAAQKLGLNADSAFQVFQLSKDGYDTYVVPRPNAALLENIQDEQRDAQQLLIKAWEADNRHQYLLDNGPEVSWVASLEEEQKWDVLKYLVFERITLLLSPQVNKDIPVNQQDADTFEEAQQALIQTADDVGLAALRVPFEYSDDKYVLNAVNTNLQQANTELMFSGKTLGLNHRVVLDYSVAGDGRARRHNNGFVYVKSNWDTLAHEWFHALDFALAESVVNVKGNTMSVALGLSHHHTPKTTQGVQGEHQKLWTSILNPPLTQEQRAQIAQQMKETDVDNLYGNKTMFQAINRTAVIAQGSSAPSEGSPWVHWRREAVSELKYIDYKAFLVNTKEKRYLLSADELMAFSFESFLMDKHKDQPTVLGKQPSTEFVYYPTPTEIEALHDNWSNYFEKLNQWWTQDTQERLPRVAALTPK